MPRLITRPTIVAAAGNKPKQIEEFVGRVNSGDALLSVARMRSPGGWVEPGQRPEFLEVTHVLRGSLQVEYAGGATTVTAGQTIVTEPGEWVRYSTPGAEGAEYIAACLPAFSPATVHRDASAGTLPGPGSRSPRLLVRPTTITGAGNKPIRIDEFAGRINSDDARLSVARLYCPAGWIEPPQRPTFLEVTLVLAGTLRVTHDGGAIEITANQAIVTEPGERVQYSTPANEDADYIAVCVPAYSLEEAHREAS
jgi:mannose-6-phosphate isomerase-like protein (cupin superfamily)